MDQSLLIEKLLLFGLGRQEAGVYLCLLQNQALSGYEVSKLTGISRSNVYNSLASLTEQGAAYLQEGSPSKYSAVDIQEFCDNRVRFLQREQKYLIENVPRKVEESGGYLTVEGYTHICDKVHHLLLGAEKRVYMGASVEFIRMWEQELRMLAEQGKKVVLITESPSDLFIEDDMFRNGIIFYKTYHSKNLPGETSVSEEAKNGKMTQLRLIVDSSYVLTGNISGKATDSCLYSGQKNFVEVFKDAMRNEIELSGLK